MAVIKRLSGKHSTKKIINYITNKEKTEEKIISGLNCNPSTAHEEMTVTKQIADKTEGVKYHHVIQSFKPGEVTPEQAHKIGVELAEKNFKGFECVVATHIDKDHIHNHIVFNSVSKEKGTKYRATNQSLWDIKRDSNKICERERLSTIDLNKKSKERVSTPELRMRLRGKESFMHDLKQVIDHCRSKVNSLVHLGEMLKEKFNVEMNLRGNTLSYKHPERKQFTRGSKLGYDYTKEGIENGFTRQIERGQTRTRGDEYQGTFEIKLGVEQGIELNQGRTGQSQDSIWGNGYEGSGTDAEPTSEQQGGNESSSRDDSSNERSLDQSIEELSRLQRVLQKGIGADVTDSATDPAESYESPENDDRQNGRTGTVNKTNVERKNTDDIDHSRVQHNRSNNSNSTRKTTPEIERGGRGR